jgi:signal transduction histidine kinase
MTIHTSQQQPDLTQAGRRNTAEQAQAGDALRQLAHDLRQPVAAILALAAAAAADAQASQDVLLRLRQIADEASWVSTAIDSWPTSHQALRSATSPCRSARSCRTS